MAEAPVWPLRENAIAEPGRDCIHESTACDGASRRGAVGRQVACGAGIRLSPSALELVTPRATVLDADGHGKRLKRIARPGPLRDHEWPEAATLVSICSAIMRVKEFMSVTSRRHGNVSGFVTGFSQ